MKKTLIALAVLAAGSASAAEVYNQDGVAVTVSGAAEVQLIQDYENDATTNDSTLRLDDGDLTVGTSIELTEDLSTVGELSFDLAEDNDTKAYTDRLFVGFASNQFGTLTFGRQTTLADDDGIGKDFELGDAQYMDDFSQIEDADDVIKYVYDSGKFYAGLDYVMDADTGNTGVINTVTETGARVGIRPVEGLDVRLYLYTDEQGTNDTDAYNLEAEYSFDDFNVAASYGNAQTDNASGVEVADVDYFEINGSYTMEKTTFNLGYAFSSDDTSNVDTDNLYANVVYQLHANVRTYAEIGYKDIDNVDDYDMGYVMGMEVKF
jgi:predicted porin